MDLDTALAFTRKHKQGVLTTIRRDGRPQLSNILYRIDDAGACHISATAARAKSRNLARDPRASLYVPGEDFWSYVVMDGPAELSAVAAARDDAVVDRLVEHYRVLAGEHPDWDEYRQAQIDEGRLLITVRPDHAYGMLTSS
jgi:PPOX class probable F420-dependent enzyme